MTMYIEQEMYSTYGEVYEIILMQKSISEDDSIWHLGPCLFGIINIFNSQL